MTPGLLVANDPAIHARIIPFDVALVDIAENPPVRFHDVVIEHVFMVGHDVANEMAGLVNIATGVNAAVGIDAQLVV